MMGFSEAVRTCLQEKYVTFSGRASRSEYWYFVLFYFVVFLVLMALFLLLGGMRSIQTGEISPLAWLPIILMGLFGLGVLLPMISVQVRRLHDRDLSGWWYLAAILAGMIPFVGFLASIALFVMNVLKGTPGPNRFGRDPFGADTSADVFT
jgi:uncharacterized membrane protein YhaH (DUF805 family)